MLDTGKIISELKAENLKLAAALLLAHERADKLYRAFNTFMAALPKNISAANAEEYARCSRKLDEAIKILRTFVKERDTN